jgi:hypothetical protein
MRSVSILATRAGRAALGALLLAAAGCATTQASKELPSWPPGPDKPRVQFVRTIVS